MILMHKQQPWRKKGDTTFDVTMGSYDGAELCELVGSFRLSQLQKININIGLDRDDRLAISNTTPRDTVNNKKEICCIFNHNGLRITIEANKQTINFLDVTFNLNKNTYQPFTKPHTTLQYVHCENNQPPQRTYTPASTKDCHPFHPTKHPSTKPLLHTKKHTTNAGTGTLYTTNQQTKNRQRNILWYNPPFSKDISTNIGHRFLALVD